MKKLLFKSFTILSLFLFLGCEENNSFGELTTPENLAVTVEIIGQDAENPNGDGSGLVKFTATADNAISYQFDYGDGVRGTVPSGSVTHGYFQPGVNTYTVTITATGTAGIASTITTEVTVFSNFRDDEAVAFLTGGTQKTWYWAAGEPGHLGVGPNNSDAAQNYFPVYYAAAPFEKAGSPDSSCLYDNELTFRKDGDNLYFKLDNGGSTFFHVSYNSVGGGSAGTDFCYPYTVVDERVVGLSPSNSAVVANNVPGQTRGTVLNFTDGGFMGYYIGQSSYEIMSITENRMVVRAVMGNDSGLAWYHIFTTTPPVQDPVTDYTNLVWSDEFDVAGAPDATKWGYDLGGGGWGNNEVQSYTNNAANVAVSDGTLKINALKTGNNWTSARLKSQDKFEFTYGKVEARAKLPVGGGTWPAIWMLGANFPEVGWPNCGEIDIMEHRGNSPGVIHGSLHYPGNFGGNANTNTTNVANVSSEFHLYKVVWSPSAIRFYVDDVLFHSFANNNSVPFNSDFFLIMNVAMGGTFGGTVANDFQTATMEVDYIRVYQ